MNENSDEKCVLIVEDDVDMSETLTEILQKAGFRTLTAANGQSALEILRLEVVDLIITDLVMPMMNGWEFVEKLEKWPERATIPRLILTSADPREKRPPSASEFLRKTDIVADEFLDLVRRLTRARR